MLVLPWIIGYCITVLILFSVQFKASRELSSPLYWFLFFNVIYIVLPAVYVSNATRIISVELPNLNVENCIGLLKFGIFSNIGMWLVLTCMPRRARSGVLSVPEFRESAPAVHQLFWILSMPVLLLVTLFPWGQFGDIKTIWHSISALSTYAVMLTFIAASIRVRNLGSKSVTMFPLMFAISLLVFVLFEARTGLFVIINAYFYSQKYDFGSLRRNFLGVLILFTVFLMFTFSRNGIDFSFALILWPFFSEAVFGSYGSLTMWALMEGGLSSSFLDGVRYIPDAVALVFPSFIQDFCGYQLRYDEVLLTGLKMGVTGDRLSPLGGYFFVSDMLIYFGALGVLMLPLVVFCLLHFMRRFNNINGCFLFLSFFIFIKSPLGVYLNQVFVFCLLVLIVEGLVALVRRRTHRKNQRDLAACE